MKTIESKNIDYTLAADGSVAFAIDGAQYWTVGEAYFGNSPSDNYSTYRAELYSADEDGDAGIVGHVEWDIIEHNCDDESNACDWDVFTAKIG